MFRLCWALFFLPWMALAAPAPEAPSGWVAKQPAHGSHYMAVTANPHATGAANEILEMGGNALDAAIAAQMVLNVVEPQSSGIGGGGFLLYYQAKNGQSTVFDGRERAPAAATGDLFLNEDGSPMPFHEARLGGRSVGVPGLLRMLEYAHELHGKLPWKTLFADSIRLAGNGFDVSPRLASQIKATSSISKDALPGLFTDSTGKMLAAGMTLRNPEFEKTLKIIAEEKSSSFYEGSLAGDMVEAIRNNALSEGLMTQADLTRYMPEQSSPLCMPYRSYKVCTIGPPSSGGVALLQTLGMLEEFPLPEMAPFSGTAMQYILEALKLAYADRDTYVADSDFVNVPLDRLLDRKYLTKRAATIAADSAILEPRPGRVQRRWWSYYPFDTERPSTTHISIVDHEGNIASMTTSIEHGFGSGLTVGGFLLNNQLTDFSFMPEHEGKPVANRVQGRKKPRSTMTPVIVFDAEEKPCLVLGSPGGARIVPYVLKPLLGVLDWGMPLQQALNQPNFAVNGGEVVLEAETPVAVQETLRKSGQKLRIATLNSGVHAIQFTGDGVIGAADPRREGVARGK